MDTIAQYNTRIIKEPRGMIRIIQLIFAILAFATTSGFDTSVSFRATCAPLPDEIAKTSAVYIKKITYTVEYPFKFEDQVVELPKVCPNTTNDTDVVLVKERLDMEFASSAQFYVATGVLSFLYTIGCLVVYIFGTRQYESNPLIPVIDFAGSVILTIFWLSGACAWAAGVSDVKYYTSPEKLSFDFCTKVLRASCIGESPGKWASLNISLIFGFANIFLWAASLWFVYKETSFHQRQAPATDQLGAPTRPPNTAFGAYGDQATAQQQMPSQQTHFPQPKQFADGY